MAESTNLTNLKSLLECSICLNRFQDPSVNEHGTAVVFCVQCDAHFCELCSKHHRLFDVTKDHKVIPVGDIKPEVQMKKIPNCGLHKICAINWYCDTCKLPACADCILESHKDHDTKKLSEVEAVLKEEMIDLSKLSAKHIEYLQEQLHDLNANHIKMIEELDETSKHISDAADSLCRTISQCKDTLQEKIGKAKEVARKHFMKAKDELETAVDNTFILKCSADNLHLAPAEQALCTVAQAAIKKQQFLHQQTASVQSVQLTNNIKTIRPSYNEMNSVGFLGTVNVDTSLKSTTVVKEDTINLRSPLTTYKLAYSGNYTVCGIAPIYNHLTCVAHSYDQCISVYNDAGQLEKEIRIPGIDKIHGVIALRGNQGKLAIVDGEQCKVHFVTLSPAIEVMQHCTIDIPVVADHITMGYNGNLIVVNNETAGFCVLNGQGKIPEDSRVPIRYAMSCINRVALTKSGFVICDSANHKIHFTDTDCHVMHSIDCVKPWCPVQTSWGHVLIVDHLGHKVKCFSETGKFLGNIHDNEGSITCPHYIHIDEEKRRLYVAGGTKGNLEVKIYQFAPNDCQLLPVKHNITKLTVNVRLINL